MDIIPRIKKIKKKIHVMKLDDMFDDKERDDDEKVDIEEEPNGVTITKISKGFGEKPFEDMEDKERELSDEEEGLFKDEETDFKDVVKQFKDFLNTLSEEEKEKLFSF